MEKSKKNAPPLQELNLADRFLFDEVMEDTDAHRDVLSIILGRDISLLDDSETEKEVRISSLARSIRLDVFAIDENQDVYDTEMQKVRKPDLAKRSRYYQGIIDTGILTPGIPNYKLLNNTYIILIMTFDPFGYEKYCYTFKPVCQEVPGYVLRDGATRIFLNTHGKNDDEVSAELVEFLHYVENSTDQTAQRSSSERVHRIHRRVQEVRQNEKAGVKYMLAWEEKYYEREEAREEGREEGRKKGREEGREEGRETNTMESIRNLMETLKLSAEQAMAALKIPEEEQQKYFDMLK
ncbi:MAG: Rpn family recombination-promoting nuclease/putative transposase [Lachnospiraceae bacterium]|nr:Rpn family recombination-promoting nuclease/putative transposase [Lachnospiraceae bacterium]